MKSFQPSKRAAKAARSFVLFGCVWLLLACAAITGGGPAGSLATVPSATLAAGRQLSPAPTNLAAPVNPATQAPTDTAILARTMQPAASNTSFPALSPTPAPLRFAVIGDFGEGNQGEQDVATLVHSWNPDFVITVGDNNYPDGAQGTIDDHIGQYYHDFISPYLGTYGQGASQNRFFPTLGNHDWNTNKAQPYLDYFSLPGNERYYDFVSGPVHFFAVDSDSREPDGVSMSSMQAQWLQAALAASTSPWNVVYFHHAPYSSGTHGGTDWMRWPFKEWGASMVLSGHDHDYERLQIDGLTYIVNGLGGGPIYSFIGKVDGSQVRYNDDYGAMLVTVDENRLNLQFYNRQATLTDETTLTKNSP